MQTLYTLGYARWTLEDVQDARFRLQATIVDTRLWPGTKKPGFSGKALREKFGKRYLWVRELGNVNFNRRGAIQLQNEAVGLQRLAGGLAQGYTIILLCGCADAASCHRSYIARRMQERLPDLSVVHLQPHSSRKPERKPERTADLAAPFERKADGSIGFKPPLLSQQTELF